VEAEAAVVAVITGMQMKNTRHLNIPVVNITMMNTMKMSMMTTMVVDMMIMMMTMIIMILHGILDDLQVVPREIITAAEEAEAVEDIAIRLRVFMIIVITIEEGLLIIMIMTITEVIVEGVVVEEEEEGNNIIDVATALIMLRHHHFTSCYPAHRSRHKILFENTHSE
jgi:hypothetical protein